MRDVDEGDADFLLDALELILHLFAQLQVQRAQRLVQQQHLRLIDQRAGDRHTLLLSAGKQRDILVLIALQADQLEHLHHLLLDDVFAHLADLQPECDILIYAHVREQRVFLKYGVQLPLMRRHLGDILSVKDDRALICVQKTAQDA